MYVSKQKYALQSIEAADYEIYRRFFFINFFLNQLQNSLFINMSYILNCYLLIQKFSKRSQTSNVKKYLKLR